MQELREMEKNPPDCIIAVPLDDDLFEWHFTIKGADNTEFEGGKYHGKFILPSEYPFKAPDIIMLTKSGRFEVGKKICLNFTGYHHELWQPAWTIRTMLTALRAFMETPAKGVGSISVDKAQRKKYAKLSNQYKCSKCNVCLRDAKFPKIERNTATKAETHDTNKSVQNDENENEENAPEQPSTTTTTTTDEHEHIINGNQQNELNEVQAVVDQELERAPNPLQQAENENAASSSTTSSTEIAQFTEPTQSRKDKILDSFTIFLVVIICAILLKKFAYRILEQL